MRRRPPRALLTTSIALLASVVAACSGGSGEDGSATTTAPAAELAPSQLTASTIARPDTPPPCDPADVAAWTARVDAFGGTASGVIRVRNDGDSWCEVDVGASERLDRFAEPDVWLEPGDWADLVVGEVVDGGGRCDDERVVTMVEVTVGDEPRTIATSAVVECAWALVAFYPADAPEWPCDPAELTTVRVDDAVLVRNSGFTSCVLGPLAAADGIAIGDDGDVLRLDALAGGDVIAYPVSTPGDACDAVTATLRFGDVGGDEIVVEVDGMSTCDVLGSGVPYFAGDAGPLGAVSGDADAALAALDPFGAG